MKFRLGKVAKECNQSISTLSNFLKNKGLGLAETVPYTELNFKQYQIRYEPLYLINDKKNN
jgi:hypothetical protein